MEAFVSSVSVENTPNLFQELKAKNMSGMISHQDEDIQTYLLVILNLLLPNLSTSDVKYFLRDAVRTFPDHISEKCRHAFYQLVIKLHSSKKVENEVDLKQLLKLSILKGQSDSDEEIRNGILSYINREVLANEISSRLGEVLRYFF